jgi:hypothetical protein
MKSIEQEKLSIRSRELAVSLYDKWVRERQTRPDLRFTDNPKELEKIAKENFSSQKAEPRRKHLADLKELNKSMEFPDQVALLAMMELPVLETSTLLHRLSRQVAADPNAVYFSKVNMADNCGCGCGCGCAAMASLGYEEKIILESQAKPYSVDPFNELGTPAATRDKLLALEFIGSFQAISEAVGDKVNRRYFQMAQDFA